MTTNKCNWTALGFIVTLAALCCAPSARADQFTLTYRDQYPDQWGYTTSASVVLTGNLIGPNTYLITSANGAETATEDFYPYSTFSYAVTLYPNPNQNGASNQVDFNGGYFVYDNVLTFPTGSVQSFDLNGLLLIAQNNPSSGLITGINIYYGPQEYGTYGYWDFQLNPYAGSSDTQATVSVTRVPEPSGPVTAQHH